MNSPLRDFDKEIKLSIGFDSIRKSVTKRVDRLAIDDNMVIIFQCCSKLRRVEHSMPNSIASNFDISR